MFIRTERSIKDFMLFYPVVTTLVIINLVIWVLTDFFPTEFGRNVLNWGAGNNLLTLNGEYWRIFTGMFLHAGFMHVLFNSFSLVLFGPALEQMIGKWKFIFAYLGAGIIGNIGTYFIEPTSPTFHIGASGAVYGLFGVYVYMMFMRKELIDQANARLVLIILALGVVMTFANPQINTAAHLFGCIGGVLVAPLALKHAQPFSIYRNVLKKQKRQSRSSTDGPQFNPDRWKKRRPRTEQQKQQLVWVILGGIVLIILLRTLIFG